MAYTPKRCLAYDWTNTAHRPEVLATLDLSLFSSLHNWNTWCPPELEALNNKKTGENGGGRKIPFQPMIRTPAQLEGVDWAMARDSPEDTLHFYNEPERLDGVSPEKAAERWRALVLPLRRGGDGARRRRLIGPACASDEQGSRWLDAFMGLLHPGDDEWPDALALHYYGADADAAVAYLAARHAAYPRLPVVVSEIACTSRDAAEVRRWTARLANWMDATAWVEEYAFFGYMHECADSFVSPAAQLMDGEGRATALMGKLTREKVLKW